MQRATATALLCAGVAYALAQADEGTSTSDVRLGVEPAKRAAYFGEQIPGLGASDRASAERGQRLFVNNWDIGEPFARNASSCLSCHSIPMPGGSGTSPNTLVVVDINADPGTRYAFIQRYSHGAIAEINTTAQAEMRRAPALFGIGYLESPLAVLHEVSIPLGATPLERRGNGFGFGWFGKVERLEEFVSLAFADELGVSTPWHCARFRVVDQYPSKCKAVVSENQIADVAAFIRYLAPPPSRIDSGKAHGAIAFWTSGCSSCHTPVTITAAVPGSVLGGARLEPYTDTKAHDVGTARGFAVRTPPLWGLNSVGPPYLHDGSANSIEDAILKHFGEAAASRSIYLTLTSENRSELIEFLKSL